MTGWLLPPVNVRKQNDFPVRGLLCLVPSSNPTFPPLTLSSL